MFTNILAIETSTNACSVAVYQKGNILEQFGVMERQHAHEVLPMVESLLSEAGLAFSQVDGLAFGCGPGSFTGLRIAASVIQGLAVAWDKPVAPISTLHALAQGIYREFGEKQVFSCLDARMGEVYGGFYVFSEETQKMQPFSPDFLAHPEKIVFPDEFRWVYAGKWPGASLDFYPHAYDVVDLAISCFERGEYVAAEQALPVYLRNKVTG